MKRAFVLLAVLAARSSMAATDVPQIFEPAIISTAPLAESSGTFSPDGNEFYFTARNPTTTSRPLSVICVSRRVGGRWRTPQVVPFSGVAWDAAPSISPDGKRLFFMSTRHPDSPQRADTDIWFVERQGDHWSEPANLGEPVNTTSDEQTPSVAADGTLYFASSRDGGKGSTDLYRARLVDGKYEQPENLAEINSDATEIAPYVTADQRLLLFTAVGRPDMRLAGGRPYSRADLYVSFHRDGHWSAPQQLPDPINTVASETYAFLSPDGNNLYFTSEREPYFVPVAKGLTTAKMNRTWREIENGLSNIYVVRTPEMLRSATAPGGSPAHPQ
ncbi:MAG: TolB family protein [Thermoanaerobaculia bacterium]